MRKDWETRTPRWRSSLTLPRVKRVIEALEYFITMRDLQEDPRYAGDLEYFQQTLNNFESSLPERAASSAPLFEEDWGL